MIDLKIDLKEQHTISPYLYMQFMEPLGTCDSSVDCGWDYRNNRWYPQLIDKVVGTLMQWLQKQTMESL